MFERLKSRVSKLKSECTIPPEKYHDAVVDFEERGILPKSEILREFIHNRRLFMIQAEVMSCGGPEHLRRDCVRPELSEQEFKAATKFWESRQ